MPSASEPDFVKLLKSPGIDSKPVGPVRQPYMTYWPARLHRLAELIPWNRFLGFLNVYEFGLHALSLTSFENHENHIQYCIIAYIAWEEHT